MDEMTKGRGLAPGDKAVVRSRAWYESNKDTCDDVGVDHSGDGWSGVCYFTGHHARFCGMPVTVTASDGDYLKIDADKGALTWVAGMFEPMAAEEAGKAFAELSEKDPRVARFAAEAAAYRMFANTVKETLSGAVGAGLSDVRARDDGSGAEFRVAGRRYSLDFVADAWRDTGNWRDVMLVLSGDVPVGGRLWNALGRPDAADALRCAAAAYVTALEKG